MSSDWGVGSMYSDQVSSYDPYEPAPLYMPQSYVNKQVQEGSPRGSPSGSRPEHFGGIPHRRAYRQFERRRIPPAPSRNWSATVDGDTVVLFLAVLLGALLVYATLNIIRAVDVWKNLMLAETHGAPGPPGT
jgi:hypothetical protein